MIKKSGNKETVQTKTLQTDKTTEKLESIGNYKILEVIGKGGMGTVYLAQQEKPIRRKVALKVIKPGMDSKEIVARFESEQQALALMNHPDIAQVYDSGETEQGYPYFIMEYVPGLPIIEYCDKNRMSTQERLKLFEKVCDAIQHAHFKGIVHRDIKSSNVLVTFQDEKHIPKIIDFGIAKALTGQGLTEKTLHTVHGVAVGTPIYMSPEQAELTGYDIDTRTDVYSLGVLLYELLVGVTPFEEKKLEKAGLVEILRIIREDEPPRPSTRFDSLGGTSTEIAKKRGTSEGTMLKQIKGDMDWIVMKAIEKDRKRRYKSAADLAADIERYLNQEPILARPPSTVYRFKKYIRRHKTLVVAAALVILAMVIGITGTSIGLVKAKQAQKVAKTEARTSKQVSEFLVDLFEVSDPSEARGNTITAREILDKGAENIDKELKNQPEIQATFMTTIGAVYQNLGLYGQAAPLFENALKIRRQLYGDDHLAVCSSMSNLGNLLIDKADYEGAEPLLSKAVEIHRRLKGDQKQYAIILNNLAGLLLEKRDLEAAEPLFREALEIQRKLFGEEDPDVADTLHNLAGVLYQKGDYPGAGGLFRETLEIRQKLQGYNHHDVAGSMDTLAQVLYRQGEYEEAELLYREALLIRRKVLGNEHPSVALNLNNLAILLGDKGDYESAESLSRESLAINRKVWGNKHPYVAISLNCLAKQLQGKEEYEEAERLFRESLAIFHEVLGNEHPNVAFLLNNLAALLCEKQEYAKAEPLIREALVMRRKLLGDNHPDVAYSLHDLAALLYEKGNYKEAETLYRESLEIRQEALPDVHLKTISSMRELGSCLTKLKRFEEAEKFLLESYKNLESKKEKSDKDIIKALNYIIELYKVWGKPEKAAEWSKGLF